MMDVVIAVQIGYHLACVQFPVLGYPSVVEDGVWSTMKIKYFWHYSVRVMLFNTGASFLEKSKNQEFTV